MKITSDWLFVISQWIIIDVQIPVEANNNNN